MLIVPVYGEVQLPFDHAGLDVPHAMLVSLEDGFDTKFRGKGAFISMYRLRNRKPYAVIASAKRAGLCPHQPDVDPPARGSPESLRRGSLSILEVERWRLRAAQEDEECGVLLSRMEKGENANKRKYERSAVELALREHKEYCIQDGLLSKRLNSSTGESAVPVIPEGGANAIIWGGKKCVLTWRRWILYFLYNSTVGAHVGMPHLQEKVQEIAWWTGIFTDCASWCKRCSICKMVKGQTHGSVAWRSERYTSPFRVLMIDLMGEFKPMSEGCSYVLSAIDVFSLWLWLVPIEDKRAEVVAGALYRHVYLDLAGFPFILRSDNGPEFISDLTGELNRLIGAAQVFGSPYHPRFQGSIEGSHKPVEEIIQCYVSEYPDDWATQLPIAR